MRRFSRAKQAAASDPESRGIFLYVASSPRMQVQSVGHGACHQCFLSTRQGYTPALQKHVVLVLQK